jgi:catechol 2,3-dioxygenase-like lactoylglutathione lyase family enzyme
VTSTSVSVVEIEHVALIVEDYDEAIRFFVDVVGSA